MRRRILFAGLVLGALLSSCSCPQKKTAGDSLDRFWIHPVGTQWDFDVAFANERGPVTRRAEFRVTEISPRTAFEYDLFNPPDPGATASMDEYWYVEDGFVVWGSGDDGDITPYWRVFKLGSKKGDQWTGPPGEGIVRHLGAERIQVPAGAFDAVHVRIEKAEDGKTHDFWFTNDEGLIRWSTKGPGGTADFVLRRYQRG